MIFERKNIGGEIAFYGLTDWWLNNFSDDEQKYIIEHYHPMGTDPNRSPLIDGELINSNTSRVMFLVCLATWFVSPKDRDIGRKIVEKSLEFQEINNDDEVLDRHFAFSTAIPFYYYERENPIMLEKTIQICLSQIEIATKAAAAFFNKYPGSSLPIHLGYEQLVIIYDKQKNLKEAIKLCRQAKEQGWSGSWDNRIERYYKKLEKNKYKLK